MPKKKIEKKEVIAVIAKTQNRRRFIRSSNRYFNGES